MASVIDVQRVLAEMPEKMLPSRKLALRAGVPPKRFWKIVGTWLDRGHLSRERIKGAGWCYYLTDAQRHVYLVKKALGPGVRVCVPPSAVVDENVDVASNTATSDLPGRLAFLRMLKEKTVFSEHATLSLIIRDYEAAMKQRHANENWADRRAK